jgi:O-methyltransferase
MSETFAPIANAEPGDLYLDLMKRSLMNWVYADVELMPVRSSSVSGRIRQRLARLLAWGEGGVLARSGSFNSAQRLEGTDWPPTAHTMVGLKRLNNLQQCVEDVLNQDVPGDLLEAGVWRGGASIFMRAILKVRGVKDRAIWLADSYAGLPPPDTTKYPLDADSRLHESDRLAIPLERVRANFERYGLLDEQVHFLKGWFKDTLPTAPVTKLALIRLDGDMYESTMDAISSLYPKLSIGGYIIVDDYGGVPACRQAITDYRSANGITDEIAVIDWTGVFWRRSR